MKLTTALTIQQHHQNGGSEITRENDFPILIIARYTLGQSGNGSNGAGETLFVMHMEFTAEDLAPDLVPRVDVDPRTLTYSYTKNFTGYVWVETGGGNNSSGYYAQSEIPVTHQVPCSMFYIFEDVHSDEWSYRIQMYNSNGNMGIISIMFTDTVMILIHQWTVMIISELDGQT